MSLLKSLGLEGRSLRHKLVIAFSLMAVIPLLIMAYFVTNYVFPAATENMLQITVIILFALWLAWAGYILIKEIILPVIDLAGETKSIANGQYNTRITLEREDELGEIADAVNTMTDKMRGYLGELKEYSKETTTLNIKIHKKVLTLTNLMKLGDLISSGVEFKEMADFAIERMAGELFESFCAVYLAEEKDEGYSLESFLNNSSNEIDTDEIMSEFPGLEKSFQDNEYLLVDSHALVQPWQKKLRQKQGEINVVLFPMKIKTHIIGVIMFGNFGKGIEFNDDDIEILRTFERELVLGYQSSKVLERVKKLEITDSVTGLYTFSYLQDRLEDEITRSMYYQRPCSFLVINVDDFRKYSELYGESKARQVLKKIAEVLNKNMPPVGKAAKAEHDEFGVLLPEKNKREGLSIAEDIRSKIGHISISSKDDEGITVSIGVGENPIDGTNASQIIERARQYVKKAKQKGKNSVVGE